MTPVVLLFRPQKTALYLNLWKKLPLQIFTSPTLKIEIVINTNVKKN